MITPDLSYSPDRRQGLSPCPTKLTVPMMLLFLPVMFIALIGLAAIKVMEIQYLPTLLGFGFC